MATQVTFASKVPDNSLGEAAKKHLTSLMGFQRNLYELAEHV